MRAIVLSVYHWLITSVLLSIGIMIIIFQEEAFSYYYFLLLFMIITLIISVPALFAFNGLLNRLFYKIILWQYKLRILYAGMVIICIIYFAFISFTFFGAGFNDPNALYLLTNFIASPTIAMLVLWNRLKFFLSANQPDNLLINKNQLKMEENVYETPSNQNRITVKAIITGVMILLLLIPTVFIQSLVKERKARQSEVIKEVGSKWADAQLLSGPYLFIPYEYTTTTSDGKSNTFHNELIILPDNLKTSGEINGELRKRSIYKVPLYRAALQQNGIININIPSDVDEKWIKWKDARICYNISDFKGIEEEIKVIINNQTITLEPGLPSTTIGSKGLSAPLPINNLQDASSLSFNMAVNIKGSVQLQFLPMAGNSSFQISSDWKDPSFSGNSLPSVREVNENGFTASWNFNKANLPFTTNLKNARNLNTDELSFGVNILQPTDAYSKTERSIKYALLFIGLTLSLFFIIELVQKTSLHPVQYMLIGLALVIFYTLLLSISEFLEFNIAYVIAAFATILLITIYGYSHFKSIKTAAIFFSALTCLYAFTFMLINMEDMALLAGSIGLFIILGIAMYISGRINWYGKTNPVNATESI